MKQKIAYCTNLFVGLMSWGAWLTMVFRLVDSGSFAAIGLGALNRRFMKSAENAQ